jgi:hypothetical protein
MDNRKVIEVLEKYTIHKYLEKLLQTQMHKITLFTVFPHTGAPNLSDPQNFILVDGLTEIVGLNSGNFQN